MRTVVHVTVAGAAWWKKTAEGWEALEPSAHDVNKPVWVVTDLAEETFSELAVPRIFGSDRTSFVNRQLANRYADSVFRMALPPPQVGGIMDRLAPPSQTLTAIDPSDRVELALARIKAPLAGVWSTSMLMARLAQRPTLPKNMFVVLLQPTGMRILFVKNRVPVLTRFVSTAHSAQEQTSEVLRTMRHLENTHVVERSTERFALMLLGGNEELKNRLNDDRLTVLETPKKWERYQQIGWNYLLLEAALKSPTGQLAPLKYRISYLAQQMSKTAWIGSGIALVVAAFMSGFSWKAALESKTQQEQLLQTSSQVAADIQSAEDQIAKFGVSPARVRNAVALDTDEVENIPTMAAYMVQLGQVITPYPALRIKNWSWRIVEASEPLCVAENLNTTDPAATELAEPIEPEIPARKVELEWAIEFPSDMGPYMLEQQISGMSNQVKAWKGVQLMLDPVTLVKGANISLASSRQSQSVRLMKWCVSVPVKSKEQP
jgi:hypothetical protein